jgi:hypothetical protein
MVGQVRSEDMLLLYMLEEMRAKWEAGRASQERIFALLTDALVVKMTVLNPRSAATTMETTPTDVHNQGMNHCGPCHKGREREVEVELNHC